MSELLLCEPCATFEFGHGTRHPTDAAIDVLDEVEALVGDVPARFKANPLGQHQIRRPR